MNAELLCMGCMEEKGAASICPHCGREEITTPESPYCLAPRTVLQEQYLVGRALGYGGFAVTYLGWDLNLARKVALKEYFPGGIATRGTGTKSITPYTGQANQDFSYGLEKFLEEARVLARFQNHPEIISVLNFFRANNTAYLVMEYLEGTTLKDYLATNADKISYEAAIKLMLPVMDALRQVHRAEILHRDISPDNIYITRAGQVKVLDFGAARFALSDRSQNLSVILKTGYAPEEQYRSKGKQGPWTDVYAVGATLYRAITGNIPPSAPDRLDEDDIERPSALGTVIDERSENALMKALAVRAADRFQSIEDLQAALTVGASSPVEEGPRNFDGATRIVRDKETSTYAEPPVAAEGSRAPVASGAVPKWLWVGGVALSLLIVAGITIKNREPQPPELPKQQITSTPIKETGAVPSPNVPPGAAPASPVTVPNMLGRWQAVINDGRRSWTCVSENFPSGEYRFLANCPPPLANERGRGELSADGKWKLQANSGRTDFGTYRVISPNQVEMTGQLGTAMWTKVQTASRQTSHGQAVTAPARSFREPQRGQSLSNPVEDDWQRRDAERRLIVEEQRRERQEAIERQRQAQIEQQQQRQREYQERQGQRQQEQIIQEGTRAIERLFRR